MFSPVMQAERPKNRGGEPKKSRFLRPVRVGAAGRRGGMIEKCLRNSKEPEIGRFDTLRNALCLIALDVANEVVEKFVTELNNFAFNFFSIFSKSGFHFREGKVY